MLLKRTIQKNIEKNLFDKKIIVIYGSRQVGKTTLMKELEKKYQNKESLFFNCDEPDTRFSFANATSIINSVAGDFDILALCVGRKFTVSGSGSNDGTYTVTAIDANNITVSEALVNEGAGASISFATVDDLIWDALDQANANNLGGYNDWRNPNRFELFSLTDTGNCNPAIDTTVFPSTPAAYHWTSSTHPCSATYAFIVNFNYGGVSYSLKQSYKYYVRFVRG